jgi:hypothetical protein
MNLVVLKPKELRSQHDIRDVNLQRHMIRGGSSEGGKDSVREQLIPDQIDEDPVHPF